ncbi:oligopeptidase B, partial [Salinimicrobium sp. CDJ15-91]|nr:oligopeptidase B [Salinimicrobium oceani]
TAKKNWKEVIPHRENVLLQGIEVFDNYLVINERGNALTQMRIIDQNTKDEHYLKFEEPAYVASFSMNPEFNTNKLRYMYSSFTTPVSTIEYNMK